MVKCLLWDKRTTPSAVPLLVVCAYPTPVELQVTPQKPLSHTHHCNRSHRNPPVIWPDMSLQACELLLTHKAAGPLAPGPGAPRRARQGLQLYSGSGPMGKVLGLQAQPMEDISVGHAQGVRRAARSPLALLPARPPKRQRGLFLRPPPRPASGHAWKWGRGEGSQPARKAGGQAASRLRRRRAGPGRGKRGSPPAVLLSWGLRGGAEAYAGAQLSPTVSSRPGPGHPGLSGAAPRRGP